MSKKIFLYLVSICVATSVLAGDGTAQVREQFSGSTGDTKNNRIGTSAASELLIPVGARDMAMGGSSIATSSGVDAIFWNVGGLGRLEGSAQGLFTNMTYIADIDINYGAVGINFGGFGTLGVSVKSLTFGDIPLTTADDPEGIAGRTFSPSFVIFGVSYGRAFTDAITAGASIKLISEDMHRVTGKGVAFDAGIQYHGVAGFQGLNLGIAVKNIGPQLEFDGPGLLRLALASDGRRPTQFYKSNAASWELPSSVEIGLTYEYSMNEELSYSVNGSFSNNNLALDSYKFGGEVVYDMASTLSLAGRGGVDLLDTGGDDEQIFGPTVGFGLTYYTTGVGVTVDYAWRKVDFFDSNNMFTLTLTF